MNDKAVLKRDVHYIKPVIAGFIGGITGALIVGLTHLAARAYGNTGMFRFWSAANYFPRYFVDMAVASAAACLVSWILYRGGGKPSADTQAVSKVVTGEVYETGENKKKRQAGSVEEMPEKEEGVVYSPLQGQVIVMEEVPDDTFAAKVLGDGIAVLPSAGSVYAPFDGRVDRVYDTRHAMAVSSVDGIEILIHIGINTVDLDGEFYEVYVSAGEEIRKGDLLMEFDMAGIKEAGYSIVTPVIVTNSDDYGMIHLSGRGMVDNEDVLIRV